MKHILTACILTLFSLGLGSCADKEKDAVNPIATTAESRTSKDSSTSASLAGGSQKQAGVGDQVDAPTTDADAQRQAQVTSFCAAVLYYQNQNYSSGYNVYHIAGQNIGYSKTSILSNGCGSYPDLDVLLLKSGVIVQILRTNWSAATTALQFDRLDAELPTGSDYQISFRPVGTSIYSGGAPFTIYGSDTNITGLVTSPNGITYYNNNVLDPTYKTNNVTVTWNPSPFGPGDLLNIYVYGDGVVTSGKATYRNIGTRIKVGSATADTGSLTFDLAQVSGASPGTIPRGARFRIRVEKGANSNIGGNSTDNFVGL